MPHFLYAKLTELGAEDLASTVLTEDAISEVSQYDFNTKYLSITPKKVNPPINKEYYTYIEGLENIYNPFKTVKIYANTNIRYIGSVASRQENKKGRKLSLRNQPKLSQTEPNFSTLNSTKPAPDDKLKIKTLVKCNSGTQYKPLKNINYTYHPS